MPFILLAKVLLERTNFTIEAITIVNSFEFVSISAIESVDSMSPAQIKLLCIKNAQQQGRRQRSQCGGRVPRHKASGVAEGRRKEGFND
ncbi:MAG: hypothetical protein HC862_19010 [Scytonema sp. RU_4_4]|nr:hypothetical protein [Scytonema sp. RU_4_4]